MFRATLSTVAALALAAAASTASAQISADVPPLEDTLEAEVIEVNVEERTITVEFEENGERASYPVGQDAELLAAGANLDRPIALNDIRPGTRVELEFDGVEGETTLRKVLMRSEG